MSDVLPVLAEVRNRVGHLTLNRPAGLNALNLEMVRLLRQHLEAWEKDRKVCAVMIRGAGEKAFCAGGDIRSLYDSFKTGGDLHEVFFVEEYALDLYLHEYAKPVVALMDGFTLGGGMGLAQAATLRIVTERARLGMPETGIGYFPDVGGSYCLPRLPGQLGYYLGVTGVHIQAADALYAGLADWYMDSAHIGELDRRLDAFPWTHSPLQDLSALLAELSFKQLGGSQLADLRPAIDQYFGLPNLDAILASLHEESRPPYQAWAQATLQTMARHSPLAMSVTLELLRRGKQLSLADCFALELHLDRQWFESGDLVEGVRALLVDKDKTPRWSPPSLRELSTERVQRFFAGFQASATHQEPCHA
ncbi:enoyl-CoA hydratase/isomerase family protein [Pseudomonas sp. NBRC 100443]|uniref:enoyl-CoA hydratase/isomerase family protein n=1 Tax=Pseudomonas sp. NBRC 100443 TaxID=1113665 RepID=UPI0024A39A04|nr:enoyl-CoA hydratase/isomerase family protein [Pseudomonas sp. NBRC 100443]GLU37379.1 crotonase [Pseudomonas sp. NBRC 100443]